MKGSMSENDDLINTDERRNLIVGIEREAITNETWRTMGEGNKRQDKFVVENDDDETWLTVYDLPHEQFLYNVDNTRILAAREQWEAQNPGSELDPVENRDVIESFLKENPTYSKTRTDELAENLKKSHYMKDPILIDEYGVVWNGNRRLAVVRMLLEETHEDRFEKVPCCILRSGLTLQEKKRIESRLQVEKTFREEYGTIELRLQIRKWRREGETWEQIAKNFGDRWSVAVLKTNLEEINFVDAYLTRVGRPSDYDYISKKGSGGQKSGIEIFKVPFSHWKKNREELVGKFDIDTNQLIPGQEAPTPDNTLFKKRETMWFQQLHNPNVTNDTTRDHGKVMDHNQARKEYVNNDEVFKNFASMTTETVTVAGKEIEKAFTQEAIKKAVENSESAFTLIGKDIKKLAESALTNLQRIETNEVPRRNSDFKTVITDIEVEVTRINTEWDQEGAPGSGAST